MSKLQFTRPPYVLAHAGDQAGCGWYRIQSPLETLIKKGLIAGRIEYSFLSDDMLRALKPDIVVWQRQCEDYQVDAMRRYKEVLPDLYMVFEIDDALSKVPDASYHKAFMPPNIDANLANAISLCDVVTVTTADLAAHMKTVSGGDTPIRIVPNMLAQEDVYKADAARVAARKFRSKLRVGWGGGIGHTGDLAILNRAIAELGDEVEWAWAGMQPEMPEGTISKFYGAVAPKEYLSLLASMDLDLMIAPIEDNEFNRCKSNLRLIEGGACGYPVIASPVAPYLNAPVFAYAAGPEDWAAKIREFAALSAEERGTWSSKMRNWVDRKWILEENAEARAKAWLPPKSELFYPSPNVVGKISGSTIIVSRTLEEAALAPYKVVKTLKDALTSKGQSDILYVRPNVVMTVDQIERLTKQENFDIATISTMSNDGGPCSFPQIGQFTMLDPGAADALDQYCAQRPGTAALTACAGPAVLLKRTALNAIGWPDEDEVLDLALIEWSAAAAGRGFRNIVDFSVYVGCPSPTTFSQDIAHNMAMRISMRWPQVQTEHEKIAEARNFLELRFHRESYRYLPPQNQGDYATWSQVMDTLGPRSLAAMNEWDAADIRPLVVAHSYAKALTLPETGDWVLMHKMGSVLPEQAIPLFADFIAKNPEAKVVYADHDYLDQNGERQGHDFKPNFDLHLLMGRDYVTPVFAARRADLEQISTLGNVPAECLLYEFVLSAVAQFGRQSVVHLPSILAHLPVPRVDDLAEAARIKSEMATKFAAHIGMDAQVKPHAIGLGLMDVSFGRGKTLDIPHVSIIIPTKNRIDMIAPCLATVLSLTTYPSFEVLVIDNGSDKQDVLDYFAGVADKRVRIIQHDVPFNWSEINNFAVKQAKGSILCFLNDDTRVSSGDWLTEMVGAALYEDVGAVGARLVYPNGTLQHIGVVARGGICGHIHKGLAANLIGYHGIAILPHENAAQTGACMVVRREIYDRIGGFDESFSNNYNDVAFCLEARRLGLVNVYAPRAELQHFEGVSRVSGMTSEGQKLLHEEGVLLGDKYPEDDPYWNRNLVFAGQKGGMYVVGTNYDMLNWMPPVYPWAGERGEPRRVLLVGPTETALSERQDGCAVFTLGIRGNEVRIVDPPMENSKTFDLRYPQEMVESLAALGIDEVILTSAAGVPLIVLSFLSRLGLPVTYRPIDAEMVCPRLDLTASGSPCDRGWATGGCQSCLDEHGSANGYVNRISWMSEWVRFTSNPSVTIDLSEVEEERFADAIMEVFRPDELVRAAE
jgi:GT2 family glycosyltransferase/glycosyltransferase involved in cell wall biosynthesis